MRHHMIIKVILITAAIALCSTWALSDETHPKLLPTPQVMNMRGGLPLQMWQVHSYTLGAGCSKAAAGVEQLNATLREKGLASVKKASTPQKPGTKGTIWLGIAPNAQTSDAFFGLPIPHEQGYRLSVSDNAVIILGKDVQGLYYGLMTLRQLIRQDGSVPQVTISDWPELKLRGTYIAEDNPEKKIEYFASMKLNFIVFEYKELYHLDNPKAYARWQKIANECRKHFIEPIPELQSFGHGSAVLGVNPLCIEALTVSNVEAVAHKGIIQAPNTAVANINIGNAGFEQSDNGKPTAWTTDQSDGGITVDSKTSHSGQSSLRIAISSKGMLRTWQIMPCQPRCIYNLSGYIKTQDVKETADNKYAGAYAEVYGVNSNGGLSPEPLNRTSSLQGSNDWKQMSCTVNTGGYSQVCVFVRLQDASGTSWFDDFTMTGVKHDDTVLASAVITKAARVKITDQSGATVYTEGIDYKIQPIGNKKPLPEYRLIIPSGSKLSEGDQLLVSYNASVNGAETCCPSEPIYRDIMKRSIATVIKCMKPKYVHVGHDEPQAINRDSRCTARSLSNAEIYADDIIRMDNDIKAADPNCRMMMWDDTLNPYSNAPIFQLEKAAQLVPKDIIMCAWAYSYPGENEKIQKSVEFWLNKGFDITGSPWFDTNNCRFWADELIKHKNSPHILGYFYTAWMDFTTRTWDGLPMAAQTSWSGTK